MAANELRNIVRIKHMAETASQAPSDRMTPEEAAEMADAYDRVRAEALEITRRTGWITDDAEFDKELPPLHRTPVIAGTAHSVTAQQYADTLAVGSRARVLLGQVAAWAAGHQETYEIEARMAATAAAQAAAPHPRGFGFTP